MNILVTGATGKVGTVFLEALRRRGADLIRVATPDPPPAGPDIDWVQTDFLEDLDFHSLTSKIDVVFHLAAELYDISKMEQVNCFATRQLAEASEQTGVRSFIYTSSTMVYGHPTSRLVTEESPLLDANPFPFVNSLSSYAQSKFASEAAIRDVCKDVTYTILRPTMLVNNIDLKRYAENWSYPRKLWWGHRLSHLIHVSEVAECLLRILNAADAKDYSNNGTITLYNLSSDDKGETFSDVFRHLAANSFPLYVTIPFGAYLEYAKDVVKHRGGSRGWPYGVVTYSGAKFERAFGIVHDITSAC
ncbi:MAG: NAD(P)-dependent oxidoreductase [Rhizomicrobium sp.]